MSERTRNEVKAMVAGKSSAARSEPAARGARLIADEVLEAEAAEELERR